MSISNAPVRRLKKSYKTVTGRFFSRKLSRLVQFDSMLEHDFILLLDMHPAVQTFAEQPIAISWTDEGGERQVYVPDFYVTFRAGNFLGRRVEKSWMVETKYRTDLVESWHKIRPKLKAGFAEAYRAACTFKVITESFLDSPAVANAAFLRKFVSATPDQPCDVELPQKLRVLGRSTPKILVSSLAPRKEQQDRRCNQSQGVTRSRLVISGLAKPLYRVLPGSRTPIPSPKP